MNIKHSNVLKTIYDNIYDMQINIDDGWFCNDKDKYDNVENVVIIKTVLTEFHNIKY